MKRGFTLIELLVVVIIIGILAAFAVPQFLTAVERAKVAKAKNALGLIVKAEKMYRAEKDVYVNVASNLNATLGNYVEMSEVDSDPDWSYSVTGATTSAFTATATRKAGPYQSKTVSINQIGNISGDHPLR